MKYMPLRKDGVGHSGYQQQVKEANIKCIFDLVRFGRCKSRAEIVRCMNLSATSVSVLVEELAARGLIDETGPTQTSMPGRRPISLRLNSGAHQMVVFELSPQGVRYSLLDLDCQIIESKTFPLSVKGLSDQEAATAYTRLFEQILDRSAKHYDPKRALMIGISFPGLYLERDRLFHTCATLGASLPEDVIESFQQRTGLPLYLFNSTRCMAYAEKRYLDTLSPTTPEAEDMIFVQIQKGISCALISGGNLYTGPYNVAGQIGHFTIDHRGRPCYCGNRGCLTRYVNLDAILEDARQACADAGAAAPGDLAELARRWSDEPPLTEVVKNAARLLAFGLYSVLCSSGIRRVVLGGGIEVLGESFLQEVRQALLERTLLVHTLELSYAQAGPDAQSVGIAQHFLDKVYTITM